MMKGLMNVRFKCERLCGQGKAVGEQTEMVEERADTLYGSRMGDVA